MSYITSGGSNIACTSSIFGCVMGSSKMKPVNSQQISDEFKDIIKRHGYEYEELQARQLSEFTNEVCKMIGVRRECLDILNIKIRSVDVDDETFHVEMPGMSHWMGFESLRKLLEGANNILLKHEMAEQMLAELNKDKGVRKL